MNKDELLTAYDELAAQVRGGLHIRCLDERYAEGTLPGWALPRLKDCAASLYYPVSYWHDPEAPDAIGTTHTEALCIAGRDFLRPVGIRLEPGMTEVSQARTLAHELSHALNHVQAALQFNADLVGGGELEETIAEFSGALICRALRVPSEDISLHYLSHRRINSGSAILGVARTDAVRRAGLLLGALA